MYANETSLQFSRNQLTLTWPSTQTTKSIQIPETDVISAQSHSQACIQHCTSLPFQSFILIYTKNSKSLEGKLWLLDPLTRALCPCGESLGLFSVYSINASIQPLSLKNASLSLTVLLGSDSGIMVLRLVLHASPFGNHVEQVPMVRVHFSFPGLHPPKRSKWCSNHCCQVNGAQNCWTLHPRRYIGRKSLCF